MRLWPLVVAILVLPYQSTTASAQVTETIHSSCRFWLSTPDRVRRASNLTMTVFTISNEKHMKNVGWSLGEAEIVRTALDLCPQNLEDPLIDVVPHNIKWLRSLPCRNRRSSFTHEQVAG
jgi:hypothetical protein